MAHNIALPKCRLNSMTGTSASPERRVQGGKEYSLYSRQLLN